MQRHALVGKQGEQLLAVLGRLHLIEGLVAGLHAGNAPVEIHAGLRERLSITHEAQPPAHIPGDVAPRLAGRQAFDTVQDLGQEAFLGGGLCRTGAKRPGGKKAEQEKDEKAHGKPPLGVSRHSRIRTWALMASARKAPCSTSPSLPPPFTSMTYSAIMST